MCELGVVSGLLAGSLHIPLYCIPCTSFSSPFRGLRLSRRSWYLTQTLKWKIGHKAVLCSNLCAEPPRAVIWGPQETLDFRNLTWIVSSCVGESRSALGSVRAAALSWLVNFQDFCVRLVLNSWQRCPHWWVGFTGSDSRNKNQAAGETSGSARWWESSCSHTSESWCLSVPRRPEM